MPCVPVHSMLSVYLACHVIRTRPIYRPTLMQVHARLTGRDMKLRSYPRQYPSQNGEVMNSPHYGRLAAAAARCYWAVSLPLA